MRTNADTLLSLLEWGLIMGIDPYELGQVGLGFPVPNTAQCQHVFFQYQWQQDFLSRDEVGNAIQRAEEMIAHYLTYWPAPRYFTGEVKQYPRPVEKYLYGAGATKRWQWKDVSLEWCKVQAVGTLVRTPILNSPVVYSDTDGDGVADLFTVTVATTVTDPTQIAVYFALADRFNDPIDETWRVRPVNVSISGGFATITGLRALCVKPALETIYGAQILDVTVAANFVTTMDVYQVTTDSTSTSVDPAQGLAIWEPLPNDCAIPPCNVEEWPVCIGARNAEMGRVSIDYLIGGQNGPTQSREPDRVMVNYLAGYPRQPNGKMDRVMADAVAHLATGILPVDKCGCERSQRIIHWWRSFPSDGTDTRGITPEEINNCPWGQSMGALWAWHLLQYMRNQQAVSI